MKLPAFLILFLLFVMACKKSSSHSYYGEWKLVKTSYTFLQNAGDMLPPQDSATILTLGADKQYSYKLNSTVQSAGTFTIINSNNTDEIDQVQTIPEIRSLTPKHVFFAHDTLVLTPLPTPAGVTYYYYLRN